MQKKGGLKCVLKTFGRFSQLSYKSVQLEDRILLVTQTDKDFHKLNSKIYHS